MRERLPNEVIIVSAENSRTFQDNEEKYAAAHAMDLNCETKADPRAGSDGKAWIKVKLEKVACVETVLWYRLSVDTPFYTWTCTYTICSATAQRRTNIAVTATIEGSSELSLVMDQECKLADTLMFENVDQVYDALVCEIAVIGKQGEIFEYEIECTLVVWLTIESNYNTYSMNRSNTCVLIRFKASY